MIETVEAGLTLAQAYRICKKITVNHYENFPVASVLLPARIRKHIYAIYAFARYADDLADETADKIGLLEWRDLLHRSSHEKSSHPVFWALADTIRKFDLPLDLFDDLLCAFLQDLEKNRYADMAELLGYCRKSANPVGRIILLLHGYRSEKLFRYSDHICSALQLSNFWQDVQLDLRKDRLYIPRDFLLKHGVNENALFQNTTDNKFKLLLKSLIQFTRKLFAEGIPLLDHVRGRLRWELKLTIMGGLAILKKIEELDYTVLQHRPSLSKGDWAGIAIQSIMKRTVSP